MMLSVDKLTCVNDFISGVKPNNSISVCKTISLEKSKSLLLYFSDDIIICNQLMLKSACINLHDIIHVFKFCTISCYLCSKYISIYFTNRELNLINQFDNYKIYTHIN